MAHANEDSQSTTIPLRSRAREVGVVRHGSNALRCHFSIYSGARIAVRPAFVNFRVFCDTEAMLTTSKTKANHALSQVAKKLGISKERAFLNAIKLYQKQFVSSELRDELLLWEKASAEDFVAFEKRI